MECIDQHYRMLTGSAQILAVTIEESVELAAFEEEHPGLRLVLDKTGWFLREGEVVLNLFLIAERIYSIVFTLGHVEGRRVLFVGAIQGSNAEGALDKYREVTRRLHGLRPRDLLMIALKFLSRDLATHSIYAISGAERQHNSTYFGDSHKDKIMSDYDQVWSEHGGLPRNDGFFEIPIEVKLKSAEEIPPRKRAVYRRRYAMLERVRREISSSCKKYEKPA